MHNSAYDHLQNSQNRALAQGACATNPITGMDALQNRLSQLHRLACDQGDALSNIESKLTGGYPDKPDGTNQIQAVPAGLLGAMNQMCDEITARMMTNFDKITRLSGSI